MFVYPREQIEQRSLIIYDKFDVRGWRLAGLSIMKSVKTLLELIYWSHSEVFQTTSKKSLLQRWCRVIGFDLLYD